MFYHVSVFSSFLLLNSILLYGIDILFIHSHIGEPLDCFHLLVIMNNAAFNIHMPLFVWMYVFTSGWVPKSAVARLCGKFMEITSCFPKWLQHFIFLQQ